MARQREPAHLQETRPPKLLNHEPGPNPEAIGARPDSSRRPPDFDWRATDGIQHLPQPVAQNPIPMPQVRSQT